MNEEVAGDRVSKRKTDARISEGECKSDTESEFKSDVMNGGDGRLSACVTFISGCVCVSERH